MTLDEPEKKTLEEYLKNKSNLNEYLEKLMDRSVEKYLSDTNPEINHQAKLDIFATLVAKKTIIIKFAFPKKPRSIFHKKTFKDEQKISSGNSRSQQYFNALYFCSKFQ